MVGALVSFRSPGDPLMELGSSLAVGHESSPNILMRPPTPSDDTHDFWNNLNNTESDIEEKSPPPKVGRPRAHTVPSKRFTKLVRVPPPIVDLDLLTGARTASVLQTASLPEQTVVQSPDPRASAVSYIADVVLPTAVHSGQQDTMAEEVIPLALPSDLSRRQKSKSFRQSAFGFMQKRKGSVGRKLSVASISAPVQQGPSSRKYSTASMITLSSFPEPPEDIPAMPSLDSWSPPKPDLHSLRSHILHVDPPLRSADSAEIPMPTAEIDAAQSQPPDNAVVDAANPVSQDPPSQLDNPRQSSTRATVATGVTGKSPPAPIVFVGKKPNDSQRLRTPCKTLQGH
ncbi:hypothetical protein C8R47DRAFT_1211314 [Mycena vitilis]|nr:hypothetical protein C8R47DRAFT_1211314 [Mycena vitilis]